MKQITRCLTPLRVLTPACCLFVFLPVKKGNGVRHYRLNRKGLNLYQWDPFS